MPSLKELLTAYGGNYETTMERFMKNEKMYIKILNMLSDDDSVTKLGAALEANDLTSAFEAAHSLKGVAGNLGLTPLFNAANDIVTPLRKAEKRDDYSSLYQAILLECQRAEELCKAASAL